MAGKKRRNLFNNRKDNWSNDDKEQPSLQIGSDEYEEMISNRRANSPNAPDDKFHEELELRNAGQDKVSLALERKANGQLSDPAHKRQVREEMLKRAALHRASVKALERSAATPDPEDDKVAEYIAHGRGFEEIVKDPSVKPGEEDDAIEDMMFRGKYI